MHAYVGGWSENQRRSTLGYVWLALGTRWKPCESSCGAEPFCCSLLATEEGGMVTSEVILQNWCYVLFWENQIYHMGSFSPLDGMGGKPSRTSSHSLNPWCVACFSCWWLPLGWILMIAFPSEPLGLNFISVSSSDKTKQLHVFSLWKKVNTASILFSFSYLSCLSHSLYFHFLMLLLMSEQLAFLNTLVHKFSLLCWNSP